MSINNDSTTNLTSPNSSLLGLNNLNSILAITNNEFPNNVGGAANSNNIPAASSSNNVDDSTNNNTKISAYARLDFDTFTFYIQTLQVVLGRRVQNDNSYTVDVNLGPKKAVSRKHAKIFYNFGSQKFEISVLGRNGLFVDNNFIEKGATVTLSDGNKIQIGPVVFSFVLPNSTNEQDALKKITSINRNTSNKPLNRKSSSTTMKVQKVKKEMKDNQNVPKSKVKNITDKLTLLTTNLNDSDKITKGKGINNKNDSNPISLSDSGLPSALDPKAMSLDSALFKHAVSPIDEHSLNKLLEMTKTPTTPFLPLSPSVTNQIDTVLNSLDSKKLEATSGLNTSNLTIPALNEVINAPTAKAPSPSSSTNIPTIPNSSPIIGTANKVTKPVKATEKKTVKKEKPAKTKKQPKKVYTLEEIPEQYRTKPSTSYSNIIIHCLKTFCSENKGMSLSEIYKAIQELYPYYKYCPDGWQSSVRHNLSLNKAFRKISKEGKGWLWGLDEDYFVEKDKVKKKSIITDASTASSAAAPPAKSANSTKAIASTNRKTASGSSIVPKANNATKAATKPKLTAEDKQILNILQEQLKAITKNIKGLSKEDVIKLLTAALSSTMSQLQKSSAGQSILKYVQTNPDILTKILTSSLNGATLKVTNGKWTFSDLISGKVKQQPPSKPKPHNSIPLIPLKPVVKSRASTSATNSSRSKINKLSSTPSSSKLAVSAGGVCKPYKPVNKATSTIVNKEKNSTANKADLQSKASMTSKATSKTMESINNAEASEHEIKKEENGTISVSVKKELSENKPIVEEKQILDKEEVTKSEDKIPENKKQQVSDMKEKKQDEDKNDDKNQRETSEVDNDKVTALSVLEKVKNRSESFVALERNLDKLLSVESAKIATDKNDDSSTCSTIKDRSVDVPKKRTESMVAFEQNLDRFLAGEANLFAKQVSSNDNKTTLDAINESAIDDEDNNTEKSTEKESGENTTSTLKNDDIKMSVIEDHAANCKVTNDRDIAMESRADISKEEESKGEDIIMTTTKADKDNTESSFEDDKDITMTVAKKETEADIEERQASSEFRAGTIEKVEGKNLDICVAEVEKQDAKNINNVPKKVEEIKTGSELKTSSSKIDISDKIDNVGMPAGITNSEVTIDGGSKEKHDMAEVQANSESEIDRSASSKVSIVNSSGQKIKNHSFEMSSEMRFEGGPQKDIAEAQEEFTGTKIDTKIEDESGEQNSQSNENKTFKTETHDENEKFGCNNDVNESPTETKSLSFENVITKSDEVIDQKIQIETGEFNQKNDAYNMNNSKKESAKVDSNVENNAFDNKYSEEVDGHIKLTMEVADKPSEISFQESAQK